MYAENVHSHGKFYLLDWSKTNKQKILWPSRSQLVPEIHIEKKNPSKWNSEKVYPSPVYLHFKNSLSPSAKPQGWTISKMRGGWPWFIFLLCSGQSCKICLLVCLSVTGSFSVIFRIFTIFSDNSARFLTVIYLLQSDSSTIYKAKFWFLASKMMKLSQQNVQASKILISNKNTEDRMHTCKYQLLPQWICAEETFV